MKTIKIVLLFVLMLVCIANFIFIVFLYKNNNADKLRIKVLENHAYFVDSRLRELENFKTNNANNKILIKLNRESIEENVLKIQKGQEKVYSLRLQVLQIEDSIDLNSKKIKQIDSYTADKILYMEAIQEKTNNAIWDMGRIPLISPSLESQIKDLDNRIRHLELSVRY